MESGDRDVGDSYLAVVATADFNEVCAAHVNNMDDLDVLLCDTLKDHVVCVGLLERYQVDYLVRLLWVCNPIWKTDFT
jgi:hypothetical protein